MMTEAAPLVSVVMATYNWSSVLRYSIQSVLWQTFTDFELLVVGDGCTDDSADVVAAFADPRVHWHNLPQNTGDQAGPNNYGIEQARGRYIAYLGHDDLWLPDHLHRMVDTMEQTGADFVYSIIELIGGPPDYHPQLTGVTDWNKHVRHFLPPSGLMHRRAVWDEIGPWRSGKTMLLPCDYEFCVRAFEAGKRFAGTGELTVVKPMASARPNAYQQKPTHEQAKLSERIQHEPDFRYRELLAVVKYLAQTETALSPRFALDSQLKPGERFNQRLLLAGLPTKTLGGAPAEEPNYTQLSYLQMTNEPADITPLVSRQAVFQAQRLPVDGLLLAEGWRAAERNEWGEVFRPVLNHARFIVTNPSGQLAQVDLDIVPDVGVGGGEFELHLLNTAGTVLHVARVVGRQVITLDLPLTASETTVFQLAAPEGTHDPALNNFAVFGLRWHSSGGTCDPQEVHTLRDQVQRQQRDLNELILFRSTSVRYWVRRLRQRLRGQPW